ncbi:hypothetical protein CKO36_12545 [Rhabdochromatium marinum]|nr:hypothetical protein [Rhabdochromatium marinum]
MLSVVTHVSDIRGIEIVELENRINNAKNQAAMDEQDQKKYGLFTACIASEPPVWCFDFMELDKLENQLESLKKSNSVKLSPEYKLMGYVFLAFALATKLLKISGELFKWYNIDDETHRVKDDLKVSRFTMANHIKTHKTKKSRYNKHNKHNKYFN